MTTGEEEMSTIAKDNPFPVDESGVAIVTYIDKRTTDNVFELTNMTCYSRNEPMPEADPAKIVRIDFAGIEQMSKDRKKILYEELVQYFDSFYKEEIIILCFRGIPGISLYDFVPKDIEVGDAVQWGQKDIQELMRAIRKACGVTVILH